MTAVYYFSGSGHSLAVARFFAETLHCSIEDISSRQVSSSVANIAVVVFPVYCQNIPSPVKNFLRRLKAPFAVLIATYGRISYGNVLCEAASLLSSEVIAGAYVPMGHTFLNEDTFFDSNALAPILDRIHSPRKASIPKEHKNVFADLFPALRSRIGVRIKKSGACTDCGICTKICPMGAMQGNRIERQCIRCLKCVSSCPQKALSFENIRALESYLTRPGKNETKIYL